MESSISIIIPVFNMPRALMHCVRSVAEQSRLPDEVIIVDDGSRDGLRQSVENIKNEFPFSVQLISQSHIGASAARNRGFAASTGDYVIFLDADVVLKKHALERFYETIQRAQDDKIGYAYSSFRWGWKKFSSYPFDAERLKRMPYIHTTSLIKRAALPENPFDESLKRLQDWDLYLSMSEQGVGGMHISEILFTIETKGTMSAWLPSVMFQIPFGRFGVKIAALEKYREAEKIVREKHYL